MKFIIKPRQTGKTTELIKIASKSNGAYIIVSDKLRADQLFNQAKKLGYDINYPLTQNEIVNKKYYGIGVKSFLIDDVESFLYGIINYAPILAITGTEENIRVKNE